MIAAHVDGQHVAESELARDRPCQRGLARAGLAGDEQRLPDDECRVHGGDELRVSEIAPRSPRVCTAAPAGTLPSPLYGARSSVICCLDPIPAGVDDLEDARRHLRHLRTSPII